MARRRGARSTSRVERHARVAVAALVGARDRAERVGRDVPAIVLDDDETAPAARFAAGIAATARVARSLAYGGSTNTSCHGVAVGRAANATASTGTMVARAVRSRLARFARRAASAALAASTKVACAAPRDSASIPRPPEPANRSRTAPVTSGRMLNTASRTFSLVGRVAAPCGARRTRSSAALGDDAHVGAQFTDDA